MGTMMKELLVIISIAMVCGGLHIPIEDVKDLTDVPIHECVIEREFKQGGEVVAVYKRPYVDPSRCMNTYADIPCGHLYPVLGWGSHLDPYSDYLVSERCYEGQLQKYATFCSSQCALCCKSPESNCTNQNSLHECDVIEQLDLCKAPGMEDYVSYFCRGTCGLCEEPKFDKELCDDEYEHCDRLFGLVPCTVPFMSNFCKGHCFMVGKQCHDIVPGSGGNGGYLGPPGMGPGRRHESYDEDGGLFSPIDVPTIGPALSNS